MIATNDKLLVSVNLEQKEQMVVNGVILKTATNFDSNYRERSPVLCQLEEDVFFAKKGQILICHHNHFYQPSPYFVQDNLYSIPINKAIFGTLNMDGSINPVCGNILCERIPIPSLLEVSPELQEKYINRLKITNSGWTTYKPNDIIFTRPHAYYEIVYTVDNVEKRIHKCDSDMILGYIKAK